MPVTTKREMRGGMRRAFLARKRDFKKARDESAALAASTAKRLAPVSENPPPGHVHLRDTIALVSGARNIVFLVVGALYGWFVEFGTSRDHARPFFRPALAAARMLLRKRLMEMRGRRG